MKLVYIALTQNYCVCLSGEELELRFYTELIPGLPSEELLSYTDMWNSNPHTTGLPQISCLI